MRSAILVSICIAVIGCGKPTIPAKPRDGAAPVTSSKPPPRLRSPLDELGAAAREPRPVREPVVEATPVWQVVSVHDGDTLTALDASNVQHKVRLYGMDAPEIGQPFGTVSRDGLRALVLRKSVTIHGQERDRYGRVLARLEIEGQDVNR
jgi:endonuclease YncB( thermonuclease family)